MLPDTTTVSAFCESLLGAVAEAPERTAVVDGEAEYTYRMLFDLADAAARRLRDDVGVRPGDLVAIRFGDGIDTVVAIHAAALCGAAFVLLDPEWPTSRIDAVLEGAAPIVVASAANLAGVGGPPLTAVEQVKDRPPAYSGVCYVLFTSGSSGRPKGVVVPNAGVVNLVAEQRRCYALAQDDRVLQWAPWTFDAALADVTLAAGSAATLVLAGRCDKLPGEALSRFLGAQCISVLTATPSALSLTAPLGPALHTLISAGELLPADVAARWLAPGRRVFNAYGPAEGTIWTTVKMLSGPEDARSVGNPIGNVRVAVMDPGGRRVAAGTYGEVWIGGVGVALGYIGEDPPKGRFRTRPDGSTAGARWYRTGDRGRIGRDGELELAGRLDHQVKLHGVRIELDDIDHALAGLPQVIQSASGVIGTGAEAFLVSFLVLEQPCELRAETVQAWLADRLPKYHIPREFRVIASLPITASGKVDRRALPNLTRDQWEPLPARPGGVVAGSATEQALTSIWCDVLSTANAGLHDDLFDLGGNSLKATRIVARIKGDLGADLALESLFAARTIEKVARLIEDLMRTEVEVVSGGA